MHYIVTEIAHHHYPFLFQRAKLGVPRKYLQMFIFLKIINIKVKKKMINATLQSRIGSVKSMSEH